jgi:hypothetical protein
MRSARRPYDVGRLLLLVLLLALLLQTIVGEDLVLQDDDDDLAGRLLRTARFASYNTDDDFYRVDDYAAKEDGNNNHYDDHYVHYDSESGVDLTKYALKYIGCQNVRVWNNQKNADGNGNNENNDDADDDSSDSSTNPLRLSRLVVLRLCEASGCSNYNNMGCQKNYADYVLPMDDYIGIMNEYHSKKLAQYCTVCADCLSFSTAPTASPTTTTSAAANGDDAVYQANSNYYNGGGRDRKLGNNNNNNNYYYGYYNVDGNSDGGDGDDGNNSNGQSSYPWYINESGQCIFQTTCRNYRSTCKNDAAATSWPFSSTSTSSAADNSDGDDDVNMITSCTAATTTTDTTATTTAVQYVAPHCAANGFTIELALYADAGCNTYVQKADKSTTTTTSLYFPLDAYSSKKCLLCNAAHSYSLITDTTLTDVDAAISNPLCSALYDTSAQCERNMGSPYTYRKTTSNVGYYDYSGAETQVCVPVPTRLC